MKFLREAAFWAGVIIAMFAFLILWASLDGKIPSAAYPGMIVGVAILAIVGGFFTAFAWRVWRSWR